MAWLVLVPYALMALVWLLLPGVVLAWCGGQRGLAVVGLAPVLSVAVIGLSAIVASWLGLSWGPVPVVGFTVLAGGVLFGVVRVERWWRRRRGPVVTKRQSDQRGGSVPEDSIKDPVSEGAVESSRLSWVWWLAALLVAVVLFSRQFVIGIGKPTNFSQQHDIGFHLNAVRWALDHLDSSSFMIQSLTSANPGFYPATWHGVVSLVDLSLGSADVVLAANGVDWAILAVLWPVSGLFFLSQAIKRWRWFTVVGAGILVAAFPAVLWAQLAFGVHYPNGLGFSVLFALLGLSLPLIGLGETTAPILGTVVLLFGGLAGLAVAHPNAMMSYVALMAPVVLWQGAQAVRRQWGCDHRRAWLLGGGTSLLLLVMALAWLKVRVAWVHTYKVAPETVWQALFETISASPLEAEPAWLLIPLLLLGLWGILRQADQRWLIGPVTVGTVFWLAAASAEGSLRYWLVGTFYSDSRRLSALVGMTWFPAAVIGLGLVGGWLSERLKSRQWWQRGALSVLLVVVVAGTQFTPAMSHHLELVLQKYDLTPTSVQVDSDEYALMKQLPELVPAGTLVAVDGWTGGSLAYALSGVQVTMPYISPAPLPDIGIITDSLDQAGADPARICPVVRSLNLQYALDFGRQKFTGENVPTVLSELADRPGFTEVARVGHAALYHIDACWT